MTNGHGDVTALVNSAGAITKSYTYDAFGVEQYPDPNDTNPFRYCGEYYDKETSSIYLRARYYNPGVGRFTQQDPAMADGMNWYTYCSSNPINLYDPSGYMESGDRYITSYNTVKKLILATLAYVVSEKYNLDSSKGYNVNAGFAQSLRNHAQYDYNNTYSYSYTVVAMGYAVADEYVKQGKLEYGSSEYSEFVTMQLLNAVQYVDNTGSAYSGSLSDVVSAFAGTDIPEIGIEPTANQEMMLKFSQLEGAILEAQSVSTNVYVSVDCTRQSEGIISLWVSGYNGDELAYSANVFEMELTVGGG